MIGQQESVADMFGHSLTAKGGNEGCWSGCYGGGEAEIKTDRRAITAFYMDSGISTVVGTGLHRPILIGVFVVQNRRLLDICKVFVHGIQFL